MLQNKRLASVESQEEETWLQQGARVHLHDGAQDNLPDQETINMILEGVIDDNSRKFRS